MPALKKDVMILMIRITVKHNVQVDPAYEGGESSDKCSGEILKRVRRRNFNNIGTLHSVVLKSIDGRCFTQEKGYGLSGVGIEKTLKCVQT